MQNVPCCYQHVLLLGTANRQLNVTDSSCEQQNSDNMIKPKQM